MMYTSFAIFYSKILNFSFAFSTFIALTTYAPCYPLLFIHDFALPLICLAIVLAYNTKFILNSITFSVVFPGDFGIIEEYYGKRSVLKDLLWLVLHGFISWALYYLLVGLLLSGGISNLQLIIELLGALGAVALAALYRIARILRWLKGKTAVTPPSDISKPPFSKAAFLLVSDGALEFNVYIICLVVAASYFVLSSLCTIHQGGWRAGTEKFPDVGRLGDLMNGPLITPVPPRLTGDFFGGKLSPGRGIFDGPLITPVPDFFLSGTSVSYMIVGFIVLSVLVIPPGGMIESEYKHKKKLNELADLLKSLLERMAAGVCIAILVAALKALLASFIPNYLKWFAAWLEKFLAYLIASIKAGALEVLITMFRDLFERVNYEVQQSKGKSTKLNTPAVLLFLQNEFSVAYENTYLQAFDYNQTVVASHYWFNPLFILIFVLFVGFALLSLLASSDLSKLKRLCLSISAFTFLLGVTNCLIFSKSVINFQFLFDFANSGFYNMGLSFGIDGIASVLILLTLFTFPLCFLTAWQVRLQTKHFFVYLFSMELLLVLTFATTDLFYFYIFFESLLIPMFIMIGIWGARERKIKAAYFFFLYTLFGSLFLLFGILYLYFAVGSTNYFVLLQAELSIEQQNLLWVCFFIAFAVKVPLFPFHIWLPEAHVEAPTVGSMLLASLLLKLGGYGFLRFSLTLLSDASFHYAPFICVLSLLGVVYGSFSTVRQIDLKRIIAYSSVAHMNLVVLGLFSFSAQGVEGALFLMVGHGVVSAALFFCVGVLYDRYHSRLLRYYGGLASVMPVFATFFFVFTLANMSFPGTSNFLGELLIFIGLFYKNGAILVFSTASIVLSAVYSTWLYNRVVFGVLKTAYISKFSDLTRREFLVLMFLFLPMVFLGLSANFILEFVRLPVETILLLS